MLSPPRREDASCHESLHQNCSSPLFTATSNRAGELATGAALGPNCSQSTNPSYGGKYSNGIPHGAERLHSVPCRPASSVGYLESMSELGNQHAHPQMNARNHLSIASSGGSESRDRSGLLWAETPKARRRGPDPEVLWQTERESASIAGCDMTRNTSPSDLSHRQEFTPGSHNQLPGKLKSYKIAPASGRS
jgi:hypothetical protein